MTEEDRIFKKYCKEFMFFLHHQYSPVERRKIENLLLYKMFSIRYHSKQIIKELVKQFKKIPIWFQAHTGKSYWRVKYKYYKGVTKLMDKREAKIWSRIFGGIAYIDYNEILKRI